MVDRGERRERGRERGREREQISNKNNFIIDGCRDVFAYLRYHPSGSLLIPLRMGRLVALCSTYTVATLFECLCAHFAQYVFDRSTLETGTESAQDRSTSSAGSFWVPVHGPYVGLTPVGQLILSSLLVCHRFMRTVLLFSSSFFASSLTQPNQHSCF